MFAILLCFVFQIEENDTDTKVNYTTEPRYRYHIPYELPSDLLDHLLHERIEKFIKEEDFLNLPRETDTIDMFAYEAALTDRTFNLNKAGDFYKAKEIVSPYLVSFEQDSVPLTYGGDLRAFLLYNLADAVYYSAYDKYGSLENISVRNKARELYYQIVTGYPDSYVATFAQISLAWGAMEEGNPEAPDFFREIFYSTKKIDARILAAYGKALAHYYNHELDSAWMWFADEEWYEKNLKVTTQPKEAGNELSYSELASILIDRSLYWKAVTAEQGEWFGDALDLYIHITEAYPERSTAGDAYRKIVEYYLLAREPERAEEKTAELGKKAKRNPEIYQDAYEFAVSLMYNYFLNVSEERDDAEKYSKTYFKITGNSEMIEQLYYMEAMELTDTNDIKHLEGTVEMIRDYNPESIYLIDPLYNLSLLFSSMDRWEEVREITGELINWHDSNTVRILMPELSLQLSRSQYELGIYDKSIEGLEDWIQIYTEGDYARVDLAPNAYWFLALSYYQQGEQEKVPQRRSALYRKAKIHLETFKQDYYGTEISSPELDDAVDLLLAECERNI